MASLATACRLSVRLASRRVAQDASVRGFRTSAASLAAQNFTMPALSPTMTEGNIAAWKIKEGDSFSAGDVLLEIETDKASMDVEAQDDGVLMKIMQGDGSKGVQVGARIGVLAEPGDDINSLEIPAEEPTQSKREAKQETPSPSTEVKEEKKDADASRPKKSGQKAPKQKYPLYPSVEHLIKEHKLDESAISDMTPTGPQGRLLKGDVLAYIGTISSNRPAEISKRFEHNSHLDLSNIKVAKPAVSPQAKKADKAPTPKAEIPGDMSISIFVQLADLIRLHEPALSTIVARAAKLANAELPLPSNHKPSADELFNQVLGLSKTNPKASRGSYFPLITAAPSNVTGVTPKPKPAKVDIIDFLAGSPKKRIPIPTELGIELCLDALPGSTPTLGRHQFSLNVPKAERMRATTFLKKLKTILEDPRQAVDLVR